jgi:hypothetical protein
MVQPRSAISSACPIFPRRQPGSRRNEIQHRMRGCRRCWTGGARVAEQVDAAGQVAGRDGGVTLHRRDQHAQRRARGSPERRALQPPQRHRHRDGLARRQVDRRQRARLIEAIAARAAGLGIDRHPRLLQRVDVPFDPCAR